MTIGDLIILLEKYPRDARVLLPALHEAGLVDVTSVQPLDAKQHFGHDHGGRIFDAETDLDGSFPAVLIE